MRYNALPVNEALVGFKVASFRDGPKDQTSDAQLRIGVSKILRCAIAHRSSSRSRRPGMTLRDHTILAAASNDSIITDVTSCSDTMGCMRLFSISSANQGKR